MKKTIYTYILFFLTVGAVNLKAQSVSYKYVRNDPYDIKNLSFGFDPIFIDLNSHNGYAFGWGARAEYMMGKTILANFDMRTGFGTKDYRKSNDNTRNYFNMEGGLGLIFYNKSRVRNVPIILSQTTSGNTKTTVYIQGGVPANCRLIVALRGGFAQYTNTFNYKNISDSLLTFKGDSTVTYKQAADDKTSIFKYKMDTAKAAPTLAIDQIGGIAMTTIYAGIQFRKIRDLLIDVDGWGYRGNIRYTDFYVDVLFAPIVAIKDFRTPDGRRYDVKYSEVSRLGWRLGWFWRKPKEQGFSAKFEFGSRPGFKAQKNTNIPVNRKNLYAMLTFGLYIPLKVKPMYTGADD